MPMKWTPENNELLLYKVLETSSVTADVKAISASWPTDRGEIPTPRAITERLCKIRSNVKANGGSHFAVKAARSKSDPPNPATTPRTPKSTPKPRTKKADAPCTPVSGKRKRTDDVAVKLETVVKEEGFMNGNSNPSGLYGDDDEVESPSKRTKMHVQVPSVAWQFVSAEEEDDEGSETDEMPELEEEWV